MVHYEGKHAPYDNMYHVSNFVEGLQVIIGDFNALLSKVDKKRGKHIGNSNDVAFKGFVNTIRAIDVAFIGHIFNQTMIE